MNVAPREEAVSYIKQIVDAICFFNGCLILGAENFLPLHCIMLDFNNAVSLQGIINCP
jgi:hypothetical protein